MVAALLLVALVLASDPEPAAPAAPGPDPAEVEALERGCAGGQPFDCSQLGRLHRDRLDDGQADRYQRRALELYSARCDQGEGQACLAAALCFREGWGVQVSPHGYRQMVDRGLALLLPRCSASDRSECVSLARDFLQGNTLPADPARGLALLRQGCDWGDGRSCSEMARELEAGRRAPRDLASAARYYLLACERGDLPACHTAGGMALEGRGVKRDRARAGKLFAKSVPWLTQSCERLGSASGCCMLADLHRRGLGVRRDAARQRALLQRAAELGAPCE